MRDERVDIAVIGAGQAGLAVGYYLARQRRDFVILDAHGRVGDSWRKRWDSLRLFTPAGANRLPGMAFPAVKERFPTKDEMAGYLEAYAARFQLPVQFHVRVDELSRDGDRYLIAAGGRRLEANQVVVATGAYATPRVPEFAGQLDPAIRQLHSSEYRNPGQAPGGPVLVVGAGNSGAEIARELAPSRPTWLAGRDTGAIPGNPESFGYRVGGAIFYTLMKLFHAGTLPGRWIVRNARNFSGGHPLVRVTPEDLLQAGVQRVPRLAGVRSGQPILEDGRVLEVTAVVWATGYRRDFRWIKLPVFDAAGNPVHHRGVVQAEPGLYFIGLPFQSTVLSGLVVGAGPDAKHIASQIAARARSGSRAYAGSLAGRQRQDSPGV